VQRGALQNKFQPSKTESTEAAPGPQTYQNAKATLNATNHHTITEKNPANPTARRSLPEDAREDRDSSKQRPTSLAVPHLLISLMARMAANHPRLEAPGA